MYEKDRQRIIDKEVGKVQTKIDIEKGKEEARKNAKNMV